MSKVSEHVEHIRQQFTRQADAYVGMSQTRDEKMFARLVALTEAGAEDEVLDVACGPAFLTMAFARQCASAIGVDATEEFVRRARAEASERGLGNVSFELGLGDALRFDDASFDVVTCRAAFHHFVEPRTILAEMVRVVRPGGKLLVVDMLGSEDATTAAYHDRIERLCDPTHVRALPESEFRAMFDEAGLERLADPRKDVDYEVDEWLAHGGPDERAVAEILELLEASIDDDRSGLRVRREDGKLRFSHAGVAFLLERRTLP